MLSFSSRRRKISAKVITSVTLTSVLTRRYTELNQSINQSINPSIHPSIKIKIKDKMSRDLQGIAIWLNLNKLTLTGSRQRIAALASNIDLSLSNTDVKQASADVQCLVFLEG